MLKIGLTGGIGTGKTTVAKIFETLKVPIYYSDYWAKYLTNNSSEIITKLKKEFGEDIYLQEGELNKTKLSSIIFSDKSRLTKVNDIVHPVVRAHFDNWVRDIETQGFSYIIKEAAILFESGANKQVDKVIIVTSSKKLRIKRLQRRDDISADEIQKKMNSQMSEEEKISLSDYIIKNNDNEMLIPQVLELHSLFNSMLL